MKSIVAAVLIVGQVGLKKPKLSVLVLTVCRILWTKQMLWVQRSLLEPGRLWAPLRVPMTETAGLLWVRTLFVSVWWILNRIPLVCCVPMPAQSAANPGIRFPL